MPRSFRVDFTKGISSVVEPNLLGDGYAVMVDGADLSAFAASSYRAPIFRRNVPEGTVHVFEYRGKWHFSSEHREWAAEYVGTQERLYYTQGAGKPAKKIINGVEARLGIPRPICPPAVSTDAVPASPLNFSVKIGPTGSAFAEGSQTYRLGFRTADGLLTPGEAVTVQVPKGCTTILSWDLPALDAVITTVIYGRSMGKEQILDEVLPEVVQWVDNGSLSPHGEYASNLDIADVFYYFYTFIRDVNGHTDESGPSPLSRQVDTGKVRRVTRLPEYDGIMAGGSSEAPVVTGAPAYKTATQLELCGSVFRSFNSLRILTTKTDHGLKAGDEVGIIPKHATPSGHTQSQVYKVGTFNEELAAPTITALTLATEGLWPAGTVLNLSITAIGTGTRQVEEPPGSGIYRDDTIETESNPVTLQITTDHPMVAKAEWTHSENRAFRVVVNGKQIRTGAKLVEFSPTTGTDPTPLELDTNITAPVITSFGDTSSDTPWPIGTELKVQVSAFRGCGWDTCQGGAPAESLPSVVSTLTTAALANRAVVQWDFPVGDAQGFHVYLDGKLMGTVDSSERAFVFGAHAGDASRPVPTVATSRSRVFYITDDVGMTWDADLAAQAPLGYGAIAKVVETRIGQVAHGLKAGDLLTFSGYLEISGPKLVSRVGSADEFYIKTLTEQDDTTSTGRSYRTSNPSFSYVKKWALYVQRGGTDGVALQQGVYPIDQLEVIDTKPVQGLSVTCDSSYYASTPEGPVLVEFNPPPMGIHGLTLHNQCLFGIRDNSVVWSPVNRPDAYPDAFQRNFPFPPVALASYAGALLVLLPNGIGRFDGTDPANLSFSMTAARDGCIAPNSVQHTAAGLMYLSPRGIMAFQAELNTSIPITDGKLESSVFCSASSDESSVWPAWWIPTRNSAAWAKCTRGLPSADGAQRERMIDETLPILGITEDIRSFYWRGRYYLYFTGPHFGHHGTFVVDTTRRSEAGYPIFHLGLRPSHAHVTDRDQAFVLCKFQHSQEVNQ